MTQTIPWHRRRATFWICTILSAGMLVGRILLFAPQVGVEHDSGWMLGIARNLAERGIYATYTNPLFEESVGTHTNIWCCGKTSIQDSAGFIHFTSEATVGPGYVFPQALLFKIFGFGWWQLRLWPVLAFTALLVTLCAIAWALGGIIALLLMTAWLWLTPNTYAGFALETFAEPIALLYLLLGFWIISFYREKKRSAQWMLGAGILIALSVLTKLIFVVPASACGIVCAWDAVRNHTAWRRFLLHWGMFGAGLTTSFLLFFLYVYLSVRIHFGSDAWSALVHDYVEKYTHPISGLQAFQDTIHGSAFQTLKKIWFDTTSITKLHFWYKIGMKEFIVPWLLLLLSPLLMWKQPHKQRSLVLLITGGTFLMFGWFIFFSASNYLRYIYPAVVLSLLLVASVLAKGIHTLGRTRYRHCLLGLILVSGGILTFDPNHLNASVVLTMADAAQWNAQRYEEGLQGFPHVPLYPRTDQEEIVQYFKEHIREQDRVYFVGAMIVSEISTLVDKVFYPDRRFHAIGGVNPLGGRSYLIIGAYQRGPLAITNNDCSPSVFENTSYKLCLLE